MYKKIGILTNGGDVPGLNSVIKWVTKEARDTGLAHEVVGIKDGFVGLVEPEFQGNDVQGAEPVLEQRIISLSKPIVRRWDRDGGTKLGSAGRANPFEYRGIDDDLPPQDKSQQLVDNMGKYGIDLLIMTGGNGSLSGASRLAKFGVPLIGIPKTVDLDIAGTDYTLGFLTAVDKNHQTINEIRNPAGSHRTIFFYESMGRHAGHLALYSGMASSASVILIPEVSVPIERIIERLDERRKHARYDIVVVSEGFRPQGEPEQKEMGIANYLSDKVRGYTGWNCKGINIGHVQRASPPNAWDTMMGRQMALMAVKLARDEKFGTMVSRQNGKLTSIPLSEVEGKTRLVEWETHYDPKKLLVKRIPENYLAF